jgi:protein-tyrosine phosphatase
MKRIYEERGVSGFIDSAGTSDWNAGCVADSRSVKVAMESGIDLRNHRARQIQADDFDKFDLIVVMDGSNHKAVSMLVPERMRSKVRRLLEKSKGQNGDVSDPYHGDEKLFQSMFQVINDGCHALADELFG